MRHCILTLVCLLSSVCQAQQDTASLHWKIDAGLLVARTFGNYPKNETDDANSSTSYKSIDSLPKYSPGFYLGLDALLLKGESFKLLFGASISHHKAAYRSVYHSVGPTTRSGYTQLERETVNDIKISYTSLNFEGGFRIRFGDYFFLSPSLLLNKPLRIVQSGEGFTRSTYSNNSGGTDSDLFRFASPPAPLHDKPANLSFRLAFSYRFEIGESAAEVTLFRNAGLIYALPWWGIGVSLLL